jgi:hypothetical protein
LDSDAGETVMAGTTVRDSEMLQRPPAGRPGGHGGGRSLSLSHRRRVICMVATVIRPGRRSGFSASHGEPGPGPTCQCAQSRSDLVLPEARTVYQRPPHWHAMRGALASPPAGLGQLEACCE